MSVPPGAPEPAVISLPSIETGLAIRTRPPRAPSLVRAALFRRRRVALMGGLLFVVLGAGVAGLPALAGCMLGFGAVSYSAMVLRDVFRPDLARLVYGPLGPPLRPEVKPSQLAPQEIHAAYVEILRAHEDIRVALGRSDGILEPLRDAYDRLTELVQAAGRVARRGNALQAYLRKYCPQGIESEVTQLEARTGETKDEEAARAFRQAAAARRQQLDIYRQIEGLYDRVKARLALVASFLGAVGALVVKLHVLDLEQVEAAGSSISDHLDLLRSDLELLESSLEGAMSA
ncbi:MAG TPA: hypothetical protein VNO33_07360 [Kofleriaceae bacterium]|nr:hypothetical protein [Kofleriaceae bacterium]